MYWVVDGYVFGKHLRDYVADTAGCVLQPVAVLCRHRQGMDAPHR
jgi:hypothetical protein